MSVNYTYFANVVRIIDADTIIADVDAGFFITLRLRLRLDGLNAPEINTPEGKAAKKVVEDWFTTLGNKVIVQTKKQDDYGRYLATIWPTSVVGESLNAMLLRTGVAKVYPAPK